MRPLAGLLWMVATGLLFVGVTATVKALGGRIPAAESAFLRYVLGLVFLLPMAGALRRTRMDRTLWGLCALRGGAHALGVMAWFFAMTRIPVAEVTAMNYLAPVLVSLGAVLLLGERMTRARAAALVAAAAGVLLILRPGFREVEPGHLAMLGTATGFAASYLIAKSLSGRMAPAAVVGQLSIWTTLGLAPFALSVWVAPTLGELAGLMVVATLATGGHLTMTLAFRAAPVTVTQPATFLQLVWAVAVGWAVFGEPVDGWVILGGGVIVTAVVTLALREGRARPPQASQAPISRS